MKKVVVLLALFISIQSIAQETVNVKLGTFSELKVFNGLHVTLVKSDSSAIKATGKKASDLVYKTVNDRLKLSMRFPETFSSNDVKVTVFYKDPVYLIDVNEGGILHAKTEFEQQSIELRAQEGAEVKVKLKVKYLDVKSITGGKIYVDGSATNQEIEANTGGIYKALEVASDAVDVVCASGAVAYVQAKDVVNAKVKFGGTVYYKGEPAELITEKVLGGTIKQKN